MISALIKIIFPFPELKKNSVKLHNFINDSNLTHIQKSKIIQYLNKSSITNYANYIKMSSGNRRTFDDDMESDNESDMDSGSEEDFTGVDNEENSAVTNPWIIARDDIAIMVAAFCIILFSFICQMPRPKLMLW